MIYFVAERALFLRSKQKMAVCRTGEWPMTLPLSGHLPLAALQLESPQSARSHTNDICSSLLVYCKVWLGYMNHWEVCTAHQLHAV